MNTLPVVSETLFVITRTRDGVQFDPNEIQWNIREGAESLSLNFEWLMRAATPRFVADFKKTLTWYAENKSLWHVKNMFYHADTFFRHIVADGASLIGEVSDIHVLNYHASLGDKTWYLGSLSGFLKKWNALGYDSVPKSVVALLKQLRFPGNKKGVAVATMDLYDGPFSDVELESIQAALNDAYASGRVEQADYLLAWLFMLLGLRPKQYALLKISDFTVLRDKDGALSYWLKFPRVKQRKASRLEFKDRLITPQIGKVLYEYATRLSQSFVGKIENPENAPLFPSGANDQQPAGMEYHLTARSLSAKLSETLNKLNVFSERTGNHIHINATRFRRTIGTRAAREGHGELIIAELLDHSDTQNVGVYVQSTPEIVERIDRAIAMALAPMAQAFAGTVIADESEAVRGADPASRVFDPRIDRSCRPMGNCGSHGYCGFAAPIACYTCHSFQAWSDGPHEAVLDYLIAERERKLVTTDLRIASINDRTILAVADVVRQCKNLNQPNAESHDER